MYRFTPEQVFKYESKMIPAASTTNYDLKQKPTFHEMKSKDNDSYIVGCLHVWGTKQCYNISGQAEINELINSSVFQVSKTIEWYYLPKKDVAIWDKTPFPSRLITLRRDT